MPDVKIKVDTKQVENLGSMVPPRSTDVFNNETNAAKCFGTARPEIDPARPKEFTVACKNAAGDEVIVYSFARAGKAWAFTGLDNINEEPLEVLFDPCHLARRQAPSSALPRPHLDESCLLVGAAAACCGGYSCCDSGAAIGPDSDIRGVNKSGVIRILQHLESFLSTHHLAIRAGERVVGRFGKKPRVSRADTITSMEG